MNIHHSVQAGKVQQKIAVHKVRKPSKKRVLAVSSGGCMCGKAKKVQL